MRDLILVPLSLFFDPTFIALFAFIVFAFTSACIFAGRWYLGQSNIQCDSEADMSGKVVIITGANTGIGKETARALLKRNAKVILACRSIARGKLAAGELVASTGNSNILVKECNLASLRSVRNFAEDILTSEERVDVLVCNAGCGATFGRHLTEDGFEVQFQSNHLGHFLLVSLLLDHLKASAPARVVVTSSLAHRFGNVDVDNVARADKYVNHPFLTYSDTKLANVLFMKELDRRLRDSGVTVNALHPGTIYTNGIKYNKIWYVKWFLLILCFLYNKTEEDGAQTIIYLAVSEDVDKVSGQYFTDCRPANYSPLADDAGLARRLWELSEELCRPNQQKSELSDGFSK